MRTTSTWQSIPLDGGIRYAYSGNTFDKAGQRTWCHGCGELLIGRDWYELSEWNLTDDGHCRHCGSQCAGVFAGRPGHWGRKRQAIWMAAESAR